MPGWRAPASSSGSGEASRAGASAAPVWKMDMLVLLMLYPIVFLWSIFVGIPLLANKFNMTFAIALFIGNIFSVGLTGFMVPWVAEPLRLVAEPRSANAVRANLLGAGSSGPYAAMVFVFWTLLLKALRLCDVPWPSVSPPKRSASIAATAFTSRSASCRPRRRAAIATAWRTRSARWAGRSAGNMRHKVHLLFTWANELARHPAILDAVEDVIGPDILCWSTTFFTKEAHSPSFVSWHQDATYWGLSTDDVITAWVAFADAPVESGAMKFWPGSHLKNQLAAPRHLRPGQPADPRPGDRGRRADGRRRRRGAQGRRDVAAPRAAGARFGPQHDRRPPHRLRHPLHPAPCAPAQGARLGHAGARPRHATATSTSNPRRAPISMPPRSPPIATPSSARSRRSIQAPTGRSSVLRRWARSRGALCCAALRQRPQPRRQSPQAFLQSIYEPYLEGEFRGPALYEQADRFFAPTLARAIDADMRRRPSGAARCPSSTAIPSSTPRNGTSRTSPYRLECRRTEGDRRGHLRQFRQAHADHARPRADAGGWRIADIIGGPAARCATLYKLP